MTPEEETTTEAWRMAYQEYCTKIPLEERNLQNVFTPYDLSKEMISKLAEYCTSFNKLTFCIFNLEFADVLMYDYGVSGGSITFITDSVNKARFAASERYSGVKTEVVNYMDLLNNDGSEGDKYNMKFDVIIANYPFQELKEGNTKSKAIWPSFVKKSFDLCKENGYICAIHPSGWRNVGGMFKDIQNILKSKAMKFLKLHSFKDGSDIFGCKTTFDYYVLQNTDNNSLTDIVFEDGVEERVDISNLEFIPNEHFDEVMSLVAKVGEEKVKIINNSSYHHQREHMSKEQSNIFRYPCVYTVRSPLKNNEPTFYFSSTTDKGHFGIHKIIFAGGASGVVIDKNGEYGLTEFASAIVDDPKNLDNIKKALQSERFIRNIMGFKASLGDKYNRKIIATFRKDFWKEFVDEKGNELP